MASFSSLNIKSLRVLATQMRKTVRDKACLKHIEAVRTVFAVAPCGGGGIHFLLA